MAGHSRPLYWRKGTCFILWLIVQRVDVLQGTGRGRTLALFMYKVYINGLLNVMTNHCDSISVNRLSLPSPSFADDVTLLELYPTFLHTFMEMCYEYSIK